MKMQDIKIKVKNGDTHTFMGVSKVSQLMTEIEFRATDPKYCTGSIIISNCANSNTISMDVEVWNKLKELL